MKLSDIKWSRDHIDRLTVGGVWTVPRSGLVFTKTGENSMALTERLKMSMGAFIAVGAPTMVVIGHGSAEAWQQADFECIASHFRAAGVEVEDRTKEKPDAKG